MMTVVAEEWMSLDGVVQAPGTPDEDRSGGFRYGGWHIRYFDEVSQQWVVDGLTAADAFLLGRRTFQTFAAYWPQADPEEAPVQQPLTDKPKYVVSGTLTEPLPWRNASLLHGDPVTAVDQLRRSRDGALHLIGSARLARTLIAAGLVDRLRLILDPVLLGGGKRLFPDDGGLRSWELIEATPTSTGAILATYTRESS
jgi:dihydrofolate reductase